MTGPLSTRRGEVFHCAMPLEQTCFVFVDAGEIVLRVGRRGNDSTHREGVVRVGWVGGEVVDNDIIMDVVPRSMFSSKDPWPATWHLAEEHR